MEPTVNRTRRRLLVWLPFLALTASGILLVVVAPVAWGKGDVIGLQDWATTASALIAASAPLMVGAAYLKSLLNRTREDFEVSVLQLIGGLLVFAFAILLLVSMAFTVTDRGFFDSMRDSDGEPTMTTGTLIGSIVLGTFVLGGVLTAAGYAVRQAITPVLHRFDRPAGEPDAMGMIMRDAR